MNASIAADAERTVAVLVVNALLAVMKRMGIGGRDELLRASRITEAQLEAAEGRLPERDVVRVIETALELSGDEARHQPGATTSSGRWIFGGAGGVNRQPCGLKPNRTDRTL